MSQSSKKYPLILTVIMMDLLAGMEFDLFVPSFPELQQHFNVSAFWIEALLSVNFVGYCLSLCFLGTLADSYGRKPIILSGLLTFFIGSLLCLYAPSYNFLFIGRFLQGLGIAAPAILSFLIIADAYSLKEQQFLVALLNGSMNLAVAAAPIIGSYITLYWHWEGNFLALVILSFITLLMTIFCIHIRPISPIHSQTHGYLSIFRSKPLILLMINLLFIFVPYWIFVGMSPLLYIKALGVNLAHFGYYQGAFALVFATGSIAYGLFIKSYNYDPIKMLNCAIKILVVSLVILITVTIENTRNPLLITLAFLPFIIAQIIPTTILYPLSLNYMPDAKARVSALIQGARLVLTALSLQITSYFYDRTFKNIGIVLIICILIGILTLYLVVRNPALMASQKMQHEAT